MKKHLRKALSLALALALCLGLLPSAALAAGDSQSALPDILDIETSVTWSATTLDGDRITQNTYKGEIQVLIFFGISGLCYYSNSTLQNLMGSDLLHYDNVQVIAIGCPNNGVDASAETLEEYIENNDLRTEGNITYAWSSSTQALFSYMRAADVSYNQFAFNIILDEAGHLRAIWSGGFVESYYTGVLEALGVDTTEDDTWDDEWDDGWDDTWDDAWDDGSDNGEESQLYTTRIADPNGFDPSEELELLNAHRASQGLGTLEVDAQLQKAAMQRAAEIAVYYSHTRPNDSSCFTAIENHNWGQVAENIAAGYRTAEEVMNGWLNSSGHRKNIETAGFKSVGLGSFTASNGTKYWVQMFSDRTASGSYTDKSVYNITVVGTLLDLVVEPKSLNLEIGDAAAVTLGNGNQGTSFRSNSAIYATSAAAKDPTVAKVEVENDGTVTVTAVRAGSTTVKVGLAPAAGGQKPFTVDIPVTVTEPSTGNTDWETPVDDEPVSIPASGIAYTSTQIVEVDGDYLLFECYALKDTAGNYTNYIKLRDLAVILNGTAAQFEVDWDGAVTITTKTAYTPNGSEGYTPFFGNRPYLRSDDATKVNGRAARLTAFVLNDENGGGYTYYQLRDLGKALGFNVGWTAERGMFVETNKPYTAAN